MIQKNMLSLILIISVLFGYGIVASAPLPNGNGIQRFIPSLEEDVVYSKGYYYVPFFPVDFNVQNFGSNVIKTGTWLTLGFGLVSENYEHLEDAYNDIYSWITERELVLMFDGESIDNPNAGYHLDSLATTDVYENQDGTFYVHLHYRYYINPQAKGVHTIYGAVYNTLDGSTVAEASGWVEWSSSVH